MLPATLQRYKRPLESLSPVLTVHLLLHFAYTSIPSLDGARDSLIAGGSPHKSGIFSLASQPSMKEL